MNPNYTFRNWARTYWSKPESYYQPGTEAELIEIVRNAATAGKQVRVVGAGHSWSPIALSDAVMVNLDNYNQLLDMDKAAGTVTVMAGMRLKHLNQLLDEHGLALANLGSISEQSVAGAISTGTHGTGLSYQILASQVAGLSLITASGEKLELTPDDGFQFKAALVNLGCLGIISTVKLKVVPAFNLEETAYPLPFEEAMGQLPHLLLQYEHMKLWWFPHAPRLQVYGQNITLKPAPKEYKLPRYMKEVLMDQYLFTGLLSFGIRFPNLIPRINGFINVLKFKPESRIAKSYRLLNVSMPPRHRESEYSIPVEHTAQALLELRGMIEAQQLKVNFVVEVRFVKGDDIPLSPAYGRDSTYIGAYKAGDQDWFRYLEAFEQIMLKYDGRPHWGKETTWDGSTIRQQYPQIDQFLELRQQLDPNGMFLNDFTRKALLD